MMGLASLSIIQNIGQIDPGPFFIASLIPYIAFLFWAEKSNLIPGVALTGFKLTLLFVVMTILFSIIAKVQFGEELTNVDPLHGGAEAFLALSDGLIVLGFYKLLVEKR